MGLAIAEVIDPASEDQVAILSQFTSLLATLVFLLHQRPPPGSSARWWRASSWCRRSGSTPPHRSWSGWCGSTAEMFVIGHQGRGPGRRRAAAGTVAFGLVARTVPQMNIFVVSMPVNIAVGLLFFGLSLPHLAGYLGDLFAGVARNALSRC